MKGVKDQVLGPPLKGWMGVEPMEDLHNGQWVPTLLEDVLTGLGRDLGCTLVAFAETGIYARWP